jgi:hypothetical protein
MQHPYSLMATLPSLPQLNARKLYALWPRLSEHAQHHNRRVVRLAAV